MFNIGCEHAGRGLHTGDIGGTRISQQGGRDGGQT